ncbi:serine hydrolase [Streptomyces sp. Ru72]|uniref:serine hydrolase domain-containing protein n=1 Tax=Streptomyces sp. Ru72 TaxID=2080747 RepID=UPI000CDDB238|nr:serine hydrolase domain-containing protein [Streptomyces sp. Ru72]POX42635.1 serine hydrolase [Streptomyces sp. Ru72]
MTTLHHLLKTYIDKGWAPGAVALVERHGRTESAAVGSLDATGAQPMPPDAIFRLASITKPLVAAAVMTLVEDGTLALDAPVAVWIPELAHPTVVRTPAGPIDDVVPASRQITVQDLLTFRAGYGFPSDFSLPQVKALFEVQRPGADPRALPDPDAWVAELARLPLLYQPGEAWLYHTCSDLQGVLIARATGRPLPEVLAERILQPLGMSDTAFEVPATERHRLTTAYRPDGTGGLEAIDTPDGGWSSLPAFPSGGGGLAGTAADWLAFARMLLAGGTTPDGRRVLTTESVRRMTTDHLTAAQRARAALFLEGQGWGYGGSVDIAASDPWTVPGRYGWVGGTGTSAHVVPATGTVAILLTQRAMEGPTPPALMRDFWRYAAGTS